MPQLWLTEITLPASAIDNFMEGLEDVADSMSCFEDEVTNTWKLLIYRQEKTNTDELEKLLQELSKIENIETPHYVISEVAETDWVAESQKNFEPVIADGFFVYPSWNKNDLPQGLTGIEIDPQQAFGTGGHETTKGCLLILQKLLKSSDFTNILDMGCGSGILAIGAAKLQPEAKITAVDNDPVCIQTSLTNFTINEIKNQSVIEISDGYKSETVQNNAPYDLIISNILAQPLIDFAADAQNALAKNGYIILAGLMLRQADSVIKAHEDTELTLHDRLDINDWTILVFSKN